MRFDSQGERKLQLQGAKKSQQRVRRSGLAGKLALRRTTLRASPLMWRSSANVALLAAAANGTETW